MSEEILVQLILLVSTLFSYKVLYVYTSSLSKKDLNANVYLEIARGLRNGCHGICYGHRAYCSLELVHLHFLFFSLLHHLSVLLHITHSCQFTCTNDIPVTVIFSGVKKQ